jgi:transcriptional regulator with XRE-family HTH domain
VGYDIIGRMIVKRRARLVMSQRELALRSGLQQSTISRLENGKQYGLRWSRFAILVAILGGLDEETAVSPLDSMWETDLPPRRPNWP